MLLGIRIGGKCRVSFSVSNDVMIIQIIGMSMTIASGISTRCHGLNRNRRCSGSPRRHVFDRLEERFVAEFGGCAHDA